MAETKEKKGFRAGLYGVIAAAAVAVVLVILTIFAFTTRYTAFSPEKVAQAYTDTIVQTGDGYNAYKNTLVSKNQKFGNFVIDAYMSPYVNNKAKQNSIIGSGTAEEAKLLDEIYSTMYDYYLSLLNVYGLDNYDAVFSNYFDKLSKVRKDVIGDEYMDTEFMFGVFESNVETYGNSLTGTKRVFASDNKTITQEEMEGEYQRMFGTEQDVEVDALVDGKKKTVTEKQKVYKFVTTVTDTKELTDAEVKTYVEEYKKRITPIAQYGETKAEEFKLEDVKVDKKWDKKKSNMIDAFQKLDCSEDISAVDLCTAQVKCGDAVVASQKVYVVRIGNSWYVDNTNISTDGLYLAK